MALDPNEKLVQAATQAASAATEVVKIAGAAEGAQHSDERMAIILAKALREVFGENVDSGRFVDVSRIPMICRSITDMHTNLAEIKLILKESQIKFVNQDQFAPIRQVVMGLVGLILVGFVGALIALVYR